jgi:hypothetical protein
MNRTDLLLGILCLLIIWNILEERGVFKTFEFTPAYSLASVG